MENVENVVPINEAQNSAEEEEEVRPIVLRLNKTKDVFTLEFNRESVKFAEQHGFIVDDVDKYMMSGILDIFWYSFRMHHPRVSREQAERILCDELGGMPKGMLTRLGKLYNKPFKALVSDSEEVKNPDVTVEM